MPCHITIGCFHKLTSRPLLERVSVVAHFKPPASKDTEMEQYQDINDVETLKAMLAAKQQQLARLQAVTGSLAATKKRKVSSTQRSEEAEPLGSESEGVPVDKDDENWDPSCDSDYDDAPKKKKKKSSSSSSSSSQKSAGQSKKQKQSTIDAAYNGWDVSAREQERTAKAATAALKSIKSAITQQMVSLVGCSTAVIGIW